MSIALQALSHSLIGVLVLLGLFAFAFRALPCATRPQARAGVFWCLSLAALTVAAAAFVWALQLDDSEGASVHALMERCSEAGETIFRTVDNVEGVYYEAPTRLATAHRFHDADALASTYLFPSTRRYRYYEIKSLPASPVTRHFLGPQGIESSQHDAPSARYGFLWVPLESIEESNAGLHGDETTVFDVHTREVLAQRVVFYRERGNPVLGADKAVQICPQIALAHDPGSIDGQPRDSYDFVSRVLKPAPADSNGPDQQNVQSRLAK